MTFRPPLVAHEYFVADPPELPIRARGEEGLSAVVAAALVALRHGRDTQELHLSTPAAVTWR